MRKILACGILVLGSLLSAQVHAQASVTAPILEALQIKAAVADEIVAAEQKIRDLRMLAIEAEQLQLAVKNAKRASPKLWDSSLNVFENLSNTLDQADSLYNAASDVGGVMKRAGCFEGIVQGSTGRAGVDNVDINPVATPRPSDLIAARKRNELEGRCMRLAAGLRTKKEVAEAAQVSMENIKAQIGPESGDKKKGLQESIDYLLASMNAANAQAMQARREAMATKQADDERAFKELELQRAMHDRLMKSPSSPKKIKGRDPALSVDPRNY